jgi:cytochrome c oxidase accessory protein FixG
VSAMTAPPATVALRTTTGVKRALPTLNADGTRFRIRPRPSPGRFWQARRVVGYALIALFVALPLIDVGGKPALLIDLVDRELALFGATYRPSDAFLLMLLGLAIALTIFLVTALAGRVWCGWACPQTVWLEWVFRPIERLLEGSPGQQRQIDQRRFAPRRLLKYVIYAGLAFVLAHTFLAYFVTSETVLRWVSGSPAAHPAGFAVVLAVTALMFYDFAYFREQTCTLACPYGRLQSVLLDRNSLIVGYDAGRGEPRGKPRKGADAATLGDCIDCGACVQTCPTGIDIRDGLQMECIACTQCIDACDAIMDRIGKPRGLIRYSSKEQLAGGARHLLRARTLVYPAVLALVVGALVVAGGERPAADVWVLRGDGAPFQMLPSGEVSSPVRLRIENRGHDARQYTLTVKDPVAGARAIVVRPRWELAAGAAIESPLFVVSPAAAFAHGRRVLQIEIADGAGFARTVSVTVLGPEGEIP